MCRGWYQPDGCARAKQKTCSKECRRKRQRRLARKRRAADVQEHRVAERERQRRSRARRSEAEKDAGAGPSEKAPERCEAEARSTSVTADKEALSRAGLGPQAMEMVEEILNRWDREQELSRARLERELHEMTAHLRPMLGHGDKTGRLSRVRLERQGLEMMEESG